ncbi:MAG: hypothetical protein H7320_17145 [Ferruginibacter sp.]|nr:hypothetical protein [Ferruginibacter sp.]
MIIANDAYCAGQNILRNLIPVLKLIVFKSLNINLCTFSSIGHNPSVPLLSEIKRATGLTVDLPSVINVCAAISVSPSSVPLIVPLLSSFS